MWRRRVRCKQAGRKREADRTERERIDLVILLFVLLFLSLFFLEVIS